MSSRGLLVMLSVLLGWQECIGSHLNHPKLGHGAPESREEVKNPGKFDLRQDIDDFLDLIPKEEVKNLTRRYYFGDQEVRFAYEYCQSEEFLALREKILNLPEVTDFLKYLNESELNLVELVNKLARIVGPPQDALDTEEVSLEDRSLESATHLGGVSGFVDAIVALLPQDQILSLFFLKLETSSAFSNLIERIGSSEFERVLDFVENSRELKSLLATLHQHGIDVSKIVQSVQAFFGWGSYFFSPSIETKDSQAQIHELVHIESVLAEPLEELLGDWRHFQILQNLPEFRRGVIGDEIGKVLTQSHLLVEASLQLILGEQLDDIIQQSIESPRVFHPVHGFYKKISFKLPLFHPRLAIKLTWLLEILANRRQLEVLSKFIQNSVNIETSFIDELQELVHFLESEQIVPMLGEFLRSQIVQRLIESAVVFVVKFSHFQDLIDRQEFHKIGKVAVKFRREEQLQVKVLGLLDVAGQSHTNQAENSNETLHFAMERLEVLAVGEFVLKQSLQLVQGQQGENLVEESLYTAQPHAMSKDNVGSDVRKSQEISELIEQSSWVDILALQVLQKVLDVGIGEGLVPNLAETLSFEVLDEFPGLTVENEVFRHHILNLVGGNERGQLVEVRLQIPRRGGQGAGAEGEQNASDSDLHDCRTDAFAVPSKEFLHVVQERVDIEIVGLEGLEEVQELLRVVDKVLHGVVVEGGDGVEELLEFLAGLEFLIEESLQIGQRQHVHELSHELLQTFAGLAHEEAEIDLWVLQELGDLIHDGLHIDSLALEVLQELENVLVGEDLVPNSGEGLALQVLDELLGLLVAGVVLQGHALELGQIHQLHEVVEVLLQATSGGNGGSRGQDSGQSDESNQSDLHVCLRESRRKMTCSLPDLRIFIYPDSERLSEKLFICIRISGACLRSLNDSNLHFGINRKSEESKGIKMKFIAVFAIIAAVASSQAFSTVNLSQTRGLDEDLQEFLDLLPVDAFLKLAVEYLGTDKEFQEVVKYFQSPEFAKMWDGLFKNKDVMAVLNFVQAAGLDVVSLLNEVANLLNLPPVKPARRGTGVDGFLNDLLALLPKDKLVALFKEKLATSPEFKAMYEKMTGAEFKKLTDNLLNNAEVQGYLKELKSKGLDALKFVQVFKEFFVSLRLYPGRHSFMTHSMNYKKLSPGKWSFQCSILINSTLLVECEKGAKMKLHAIVFAVLAGVAFGTPVGSFKKDLDEIIGLLPVEKIKQIAEDYYHTDPEIQEIVGYLKSDAAKKIFAEITAMKDVKEFVEFLGSQGLNTEKFSSLEALLRLPNYPPNPAKASVARTGGLRGLIADVKACLPQKELRSALVRKLTNSPGFSVVYKKIQEFDFIHLEEYAKESEEIAALVKKIESYGIDVERIVRQLSAIFGWQKTSDDDFDIDE
ncbi:uncharacterized protein LOC132260981 [Phlebotomus argentipes]|uniref:uncharacterized protein LOC132260981 n=1 Tax=Phlebotomus argentipes TaxID=94469 RepID=UPI002892D526|nr:uncharacterized protein LOC132260981 [Phlebotomus argentipes]